MIRGKGNRKRKCKACNKEMRAHEGFIAGVNFVCNQDCAYKLTMSALESSRKRQATKAKQAQAEEEKNARAKHRERKEALRPRAWYLKEAQKWFNKFIRLRDKDDLCISCDRALEAIEGNDGWKPGGAWDCGHYLTRGAHPELRFEELNAHKQCKSCNAGSGKYTHKTKTVGEMYRKKLINKIGLAKVEWVEGPHEPKKYTIDDLKEIIQEYKAKCKQFD
ncbi:NinG protein [Vibrio phage LP.2]|nr:NinG protein [Vibrio phage LP.2]